MLHYSSQESSHRVDENPHQGQQDCDVWRRLDGAGGADRGLFRKWPRQSDLGVAVLSNQRASDIQKMETER